MPTLAPLTTVPSNVTVAAAYRILYDHHHTAAPVVDADGSIVGTLSITDLKYTDPEELAHLTMNVMDFLNNDHSRGAGAPVAIGVDAFVTEPILLLSHAGVHRVWVLDERKRPVGVVSCTDLIDRAIHCAP